MIKLNDVKKAREQINSVIRSTPLMTSDKLSKLCRSDIYLKSEHLHKTGSFKIRGATNKVKQAVAEGARYITAASSGNHGQAVAYIANELNIPSTIVVPEDVASCKENAIKAYKSRVERCGITSPERIERALS